MIAFIAFARAAHPPGTLTPTLCAGALLNSYPHTLRVVCRESKLSFSHTVIISFHRSATEVWWAPCRGPSQCYNLQALRVPPFSPSGLDYFIYTLIQLFSLFNLIPIIIIIYYYIHKIFINKKHKKKPFFTPPYFELFFTPSPLKLKNSSFF